VAGLSSSLGVAGRGAMFFNCKIKWAEFMSVLFQVFGVLSVMWALAWL
jgi:hypothetical protein